MAGGVLNALYIYLIQSLRQLYGIVYFKPDISDEETEAQGSVPPARGDTADIS